jgi:rhodanese-related sulfurtransferase
MSPSGAEVIRQIKSQIEEVDPSEVNSATSNGNGNRPVLIDVRESEEWDAGHIPGARHVPRGYLESRIEGAVPDRSANVVLYCASGNRSALAAHTLKELMGYENVSSMTGGITLWKDRGYDVETPKSLSKEQRERYSRHLLVPEIGLEGQTKLLEAPRAWGRSASSTTTTSTSPTCSARSSTPPTASGRPRSTPPSARSRRSTRTWTSSSTRRASTPRTSWTSSRATT